MFDDGSLQTSGHQSWAIMEVLNVRLPQFALYSYVFYAILRRDSLNLREIFAGVLDLPIEDAA